MIARQIGLKPLPRVWAWAPSAFWPGWRGLVPAFVGHDEFARLTLVIGWPWTGRLVVALWGCGDPECQAEAAEQVQAWTERRWQMSVEERYPEHVKLAAVADQSQAIGEFLAESRFVLAEWNGNTLVPTAGVEEALAEWFGLDLGKIEAEKRRMLAELGS